MADSRLSMARRCGARETHRRSCAGGNPCERTGEERSRAALVDGGTLYVAAFGSSKVGVFDTIELVNGSGACWEAVFTTVNKNTSALFKTKF